MSEIIISHAQPSTADMATRVMEKLKSTVPNATIYDWVGAVVLPGDDYEDGVIEGVKKADLLLVMIGPDWDPGTDEDYDYIAIKSALENKTKMIPVLVNGATAIPDSLPDDIAKFKRRMGLTINSDTEDSDLDSLMESVKKTLGSASKASSPAPTKPEAKQQPAQSAAPVATPSAPSAAPTPQQQAPPPQQQQSPYQGFQPPNYQQQQQGYQAPPQQQQAMASNEQSFMSQPHKVVGSALMVVGALIAIMWFAIPWASFNEDSIEDAGTQAIEDSSYASDLGVTTNAQRVQLLEVFGLLELDGCTYTGYDIFSEGDGSSDCSTTTGLTAAQERELEDTFNENKSGMQSLLETLLILVPALGGVIAFMGYRTFSAPQNFTADNLRTRIFILAGLAVFIILWFQLFPSAYADSYEAYLEEVDTVSSADDIELLSNVIGSIFASASQTIVHLIMPILGIGACIYGIMALRQYHNQQARY